MGAANKGLKEKCSWSRWKTTTKTINDKECSAFERLKVWGTLKAKSIGIKCIYEWSDNCPAQYKSRIPFRILSKSNIPIVQSFFCEKHGKSAADGLIGRTSQFLYTVVCTNKAEIPDAEALYKFCMENWKEKPQPGPCHHYERNFFLTRTIQ